MHDTALTIRRERIGAVNLSKFPPELDLIFSLEQLWSSKMDTAIFSILFLMTII